MHFVKQWLQPWAAKGETMEQIIIWANYIFSFCCKMLFYSYTDQIFHHFILWYVSLIPASLFNVYSFGLFLVTIQASLFLLAPIIPERAQAGSIFTMFGLR